MSEQNKPEVDNDVTDEPQVSETISTTPPPLPGDHGIVEEKAEIEEAAAPEGEGAKSNILASLERTYQNQVVDAQKYTSAQKLQDKLNELGDQGYQLLAKVDNDWLVLSRPRFVWNGSGDVAGQAAADVGEKSRQADAAIGGVLAGTG